MGQYAPGLQQGTGSRAGHGTGRKFASGGRCGRGFRHVNWLMVPPADMTEAQEIASLREQASLLQEELQHISDRLETLTNQEKN